MSESKDLAIKLFGMKIPVPGMKIPAKSEIMDSCSEITKAGAEGAHAEDPANTDKTASGDVKEEHQTPTKMNEVHANPETKDDQDETNSADNEKAFKRPDKVLPCPRCSSLDTKFCYFNNYNVNQPRHFCKNCQRYWTSGGTMRNVPVGAGRRKNKHLSSHCHQITVPTDGVPSTTLDTPDSANNQLLSCGDCATAFRPSIGNGMVLKFGPEAPLCESMETTLNLRDPKRFIETGSVSCQETGLEPSTCGSSVTTSSIQENELPEDFMQNDRVGLAGSCNQLNQPHHMHCYPVPPWVFPLNPGWNNAASTAAAHCTSEWVCVPDCSNPSPVQWFPQPMQAVSGFCPPSIPLQFIPASYWGCMPLWAAGAGTMSMTGSNGCLSPSSPTRNSCCSGIGSPTLGKHPRDANFMDEEKSEKCILVPKTLRIDDTDEVSKSPTWAILDIKPEQKVLKSKGTIFRAFGPKVEGKGHLSDGTQILEANPAALSRFQTYQENT